MNSFVKIYQITIFIDFILFFFINRHS